MFLESQRISECNKKVICSVLLDSQTFSNILDLTGLALTKFTFLKHSRHAGSTATQYNEIEYISLKICYHVKFICIFVLPWSTIDKLKFCSISWILSTKNLHFSAKRQKTYHLINLYGNLALKTKTLSTAYWCHTATTSGHYEILYSNLSY